MNKIFYLILVLLTLNPNQGLAMATRRHYYVDLNAPEVVTQGYPSGSHTVKLIEGAFYTVSVSYPRTWHIKDEYINGQFLQVAGLSVQSQPNPNQRVKYKILDWKMRDASGKVFEPLVRSPYDFRQKGYVKTDYILNKEYVEKGLYIRFDFTYDIPSDLQSIFIDVKMELESQTGEKAVIDETIPLKRATYKIGFFEEFNS